MHREFVDKHGLALGRDFASGTSDILAAVRAPPMFTRIHALGRHASAEMLGQTELVLRRGSAQPQHLSFARVDTVRANLEAFAEAAAGVVAYPISAAQIFATVAVFNAIVEATKIRRPAPRSFGHASANRGSASAAEKLR